MTYGEIRARVVREAPDIALELINGYLYDRYTAILDRLRWQRQRVEYVFQTAAPFTAGTVTLEEGGDLATFSSSPGDGIGRILRVEGREEVYEYAPIDALTGQLDRPYEGPSGEFSYSLAQSIYPLPADVRIVEGARLLNGSPLDRLTPAQLTQSAANRPAVGRPGLWAPAMDLNSDPPVAQIELYPIPDAVYPVAVAYTLEAPALTGSTGTTLLPWIRPGALVAGATADCCLHRREFVAADRYELKFEKGVADMVRTDALNRGPQKIRLADWMTRHNLWRAMWSARDRTGPRLP